MELVEATKKTRDEWLTQAVRLEKKCERGSGAPNLQRLRLGRCSVGDRQRRRVERCAMPLHPHVLPVCLLFSYQELRQERQPRHNTLVLAVGTQDAAVLGYILFRRNGTEGHIDRIAVVERQRRQGLGRRLLQRAIETLQTSRALKLVLEVDTANAGAIALYESQGFERTTIRPDYYKSGRDALLLELKL
ncbi:hypothetical protein PHYPSEUDO_015452 [Phytophthora pseudosyringae]|uniref:N-acetyltransferase domain-containing protein n=1 Tax=Phytophthora pseudosyringae TaxID=221518 RepID=A0A8T1W285_9STRA|nr:hypothetical protein PHYPSEUDO_015452 [Phytophthora pseudosyringae]